MEPDSVPMAGIGRQTDLKVLTLLRDRQIAKADESEARAKNNKAALARGGDDVLEGEAKRIIEESLMMSTEEAKRLRRVAKALDAAVKALSTGNKSSES